LNLRKLCAKIVPILLIDEQKQGCVDCCNVWIESAQNPHFREIVITGDEAWIYEYDPESKRQTEEWMHPGSPHTKKSARVVQKSRPCSSFFSDIRGVVHHEYVPAGQTVNAKFYVEVLKRLRERVRRAQPELWEEKARILRQDNAPSHTSLVTREFLAKNKITTMDHPPYSSDLAPCDFNLFPKVENIMRGEHFVDVDNVKRETTKLLKELIKEDTQHCFQEWEKRWTKCNLSGEEYFEGDHIPVPE